MDNMDSRLGSLLLLDRYMVRLLEHDCHA